MSQSSSSKSVEKAKVTFEYEADNPDELTIKVGEIVEIVNKNTDNDGWWEVSWDDHFCILFVFFFFFLEVSSILCPGCISVVCPLQ